jgi:hypothetical protein
MIRTRPQPLVFPQGSAATPAAAPGDFSMNIGQILLLMCAACAVIGIYRSLMNSRIERVPSPGILKPPERSPQRFPGRIHWLTTNDFLKLIVYDHEAVIFHLLDGTGTSDRCGVTRGEVAVTMQQFKDMLPWIPTESRIVIYRPGGIDAAITRRLTAIARGRELNLISGSLPSLVEDSVLGGDDECH